MSVDREEERKIAQIFKEKTSANNQSGKVDFLYKDKVDSEEYLLGKRIDSNFERQNIPQKAESSVGAKFEEDPIKHNERINMQIKQRDDPLSAIRKKEEDARKALLNNPLKMKQLEKTLKEKRSKRHSKDGDELLARYMAIKGAKMGKPSKKEKRKLPDDDKSLLYRYLELIGKAKRRRFYSVSSDDEDGKKDKRTDHGRERNGKDSRRRDQSRRDSSHVENAKSSGDRTSRSEHHRRDEGRKTVGERFKDLANEKAMKNDKRDEGSESSRRSHRNVNNSGSHDRHSRRDSSRRDEPKREDRHSKPHQDTGGRRKSRSLSMERRRERSRSRSPNNRKNSKHSSNSKQDAKSTGTRSKDTFDSKKRSQRRSHSPSPKVATELNSKSKEQSKERVSTKNQSRSRSDGKSKHRSSSSSAEREKKLDSKKKKLPKRQKTPRAPSSSSSSSSGSGSGSGSSSSSSSSSGSDSDSSSKGGRKKSSSEQKKVLGPQRPPKPSSNEKPQAGRSRSSSPEVDTSLEQLEKERDALRNKLSKLPSYGLVHPKGESVLEAKASSDAKRRTKSEKLKKKSKSPSPDRSMASSHRRKGLTKEEKEAKLNEMMDNAKWRDEQRAKNVARYEQEQRKEDEQYAENAGKNDDFIAPMMTKHAGESSIEDQLKRNRHKIQRNAAATEKNFARK